MALESQMDSVQTESCSTCLDRSRLPYFQSWRVFSDLPSHRKQAEEGTVTVIRLLQNLIICIMLYTAIH